MGSDEIESSI